MRNVETKIRGRQRDHFIFPSHSMGSLTVARHFLSHCVLYWLHVQEVDSLFPLSILLVLKTVKRGMCGDTGREGQHMLCLHVTRKELLV